MKMRRKTGPRNKAGIASEWDHICEVRERLIQSGLDFSLTGVTAPCIEKYVLQYQRDEVVDIGCGSGYLTARIAPFCNHITGIDISPHSIELAARDYSRDNITFICNSIQEFSSDKQVDMCIANMVLMSEPDIRGFLRATQNILADGGHFLMMITHPCFWPRYWGYEKEPWFSYKEELFIAEEFVTSLSPDTMGEITHIHRPLSQYIQELYAAGLQVKTIDEPYPVGEIPPNYSFDFPRFLFVLAVKGHD